MNRELLKGTLNIIILLIISKERTYGYEISSSIYAQSNNEIKLNESSLYTVLIRLEKIGYIKSDWENTGSYPRRKYYNITKSGEDFLQDNLQDYFKINDLLCKLNK